MSTRSLLRGGTFLDLSYSKRVSVLVDGLNASNPTLIVWEAAIAVAFVSFVMAAAQREPTIDTASGYQVMGVPGDRTERLRRLLVRKEALTRAHYRRQPAVGGKRCLNALTS